MNRKSLLIYLIIIFPVQEMIAMQSNETPLYFKDTKEAVVHITKLLRQKNWKELARYYDLSDTNLNKDQLTSGEYFYRKEPVDMAHPGGFSRYKHPFAPGFSYDGEYVEKSSEKNEKVIIIRVKIKIDQGDGMIQEGLDCFRMIHSSSGYRILPGDCFPFPPSL